MDDWKRANTDWFRDARWGVMTHYLAGQPSARAGVDLTPEQWNAQVNAFDVPAFVDVLKEIRAGYLLFTLGQNSGFFCSPNATYDGIVGVHPSRLSTRDLLGEIAQALADAGIRTMAYLPSHAPAHHRTAAERLGFTPTWDARAWGLTPGSYVREGLVDERLTDAQRNWEAVIREWSERWGGAVSGWWIDGCYHADRMYRHDDPPNFRSFAEAMKAGNPDSIVAFNPGVKNRVISHTPYEDYTAGEFNVMPTAHRHHKLERFVDDAQLHILSFLGEYWRAGEPRYADDLAIAYTKYINSFGGVVTWDVPITAEGEIPEAFVKQLGAIGNGV